MAASQMTRLESENDALRALAIKLGRVVLTGASATFYSADNVRMPVFDAVAPDTIVSVLRELAVECERLVRISNDRRSAEEFEAIGIEFADIAAQIEQAFRIPAVAG